MNFPIALRSGIALISKQFQVLSQKCTGWQGTCILSSGKHNSSGDGSVKSRAWFFRVVLVVTLTLLLESSGIAASVNTRRLTAKSKSNVNETQHAKRRMRTLARSRAPRARIVRTVRRRRYYERFYTSSFATDLGNGDMTGGEDPVVRQAAIDALGNMNGSVVAIEPTSGRILAMVNQKLALSSGAQPCSTIKLSVALA